MRLEFRLLAVSNINIFRSHLISIIFQTFAYLTRIEIGNNRKYNCFIQIYENYLSQN